MPSPLGRVPTKGAGEVRYNVISIAALRRIRTAAGPHPTSLRSATFPKGEGVGVTPAGSQKIQYTFCANCAILLSACAGMGRPGQI